MRPIRAEEDARLGAHVVSRTPLLYSDGPSPALDRPGHVRSGSALAWREDALVVVSDDANFLTVVEPLTQHVRSIDLPRGEGGRRQFGEHLGNKMDKLDLEAAATVWYRGRHVLLVFGSGSSPRRESIAIWEGGDAAPRLVSAGRLYASLRATAAFSGAALNLEGAVSLGDHLLLFQRGNGAPRPGPRPERSTHPGTATDADRVAAAPQNKSQYSSSPLLALDAVDSSQETRLLPVEGPERAVVNATAILEVRGLMNYLEEPEVHSPPRVTGIVQYELGSIDGARLTFTDGALLGGRVIFSAAAEASENEIDDGPVTGVVLGVLGQREASWCRVRDLSGMNIRDKIEGLAADPARSDRVFAVVDADDPDLPSALLEIAVTGF